MLKTLAIETSCDDTSVAIVSRDGTKFLVDKMISFSQISTHQKYGGVVPELASRLHQEKIISLLDELWRSAIAKVDFISTTTHPGLPGSLLIGKATSQFLASYFDKKTLPINHIQWHIFSLLLERNINSIQFPLAVLTASGGHNDIYIVNYEPNSDTNNKIPNIHDFQTTKLWQTQDDAAGEAFDKVARMLGGSYPGGPRISNMADLGQNIEINQLHPKLQSLQNNNNLLCSGKFFKRIRVDKKKLDFSFSGTKSQVYNFLQKLKRLDIELTTELIQLIAYEFQESVVEVLTHKLYQAAELHQANTLAICGGVSANNRRRDYLNLQNIHHKLIIKPIKKKYSTDNAAMIGVVGILSRKG